MKKLRVIRIALTVFLFVRAFLLVMGSGVTEAAEKEPETDVLEITWDDSQNSSEMKPVVLHFSFRDGTVIDQELSYYPSIVEETAFRDITGDGKDEALVYRYFANTAAEYTLIDIFEVKDGAVSCISPETELAELAGNVWNMTMIESCTDGNTKLVFRMESYDKEKGMTFLDETLLVAYEENGWQILGQVSWKVRCAVQKIKDAALQFGEE